MSELLPYAGTALGALGIGAVLVKLLDPANRAKARATDADTLRGIIGDLQSADAKKAAQIDSLSERVGLLEERERHMLTRAAVHEAWDQLAFQALLTMNPEHPPPPPLAIRRGAEDED